MTIGYSDHNPRADVSPEARARRNQKQRERRARARAEQLAHPERVRISKRTQQPVRIHTPLPADLTERAAEARRRHNESARASRTRLKAAAAKRRYEEHQQAQRRIANSPHADLVMAASLIVKYKS